MPSTLDSIGEDIITFSGCPSAALVCLSVRSFVRSDRYFYHDISWTVRYEQFWRNLSGIFSSLYWWPTRYHTKKETGGLEDKYD